MLPVPVSSSPKPFASSGLSPTVVQAASSGLQVEARARLLQGGVCLREVGLACGVLEQDIGDVVLHVVLLLKNASAVRFRSICLLFNFGRVW